jgi:hypothetical protein
MSPRNHFAKEMYGPYFLEDKHFSCDCDKDKKRINPIRNFIDRLFRTPAKVEVEQIPEQAKPKPSRPATQEEIDAYNLRREQRKQSNQ